MPEQETFAQKFLEILQKNKALKPADAQGLMEAFKERLPLNVEEFLIHEGLINREQLLKALSDYYKVPALDVRGEFFDHHVVTMIPEDVLLRHSFIPYALDGDVLTVVAAQPDELEIPEIIGQYVSYDIDLVVGYFRDINDEIEDFYAPALTQDPETADQDLDREHEREQEAEKLEELE